MNKYILFDTETTGIQEEDKIIQVGAIVLDRHGNVKVFNELCSCETPIKYEAMEIHNITQEDIQNKPPFIQSEFYKHLQELNNEQNYLIAHNMPFDLGMLKKEGFVENIRLIDTLKCARHLMPKSRYHRLQYFRYSLELYKNEQEEAKKYNITIKAHDAIGDVLVMKMLLSKLVELARKEFPNEKPMEKLEELSKKPINITKFNFGKYKGRKIVDIYSEDIGYFNFVKNKMQIDEDMRYSLEKIEKGH